MKYWVVFLCEVLGIVSGSTCIYGYCFTSLSAQSWQYRDKRKPEARNMPYSYFECLQGFFIVHSAIGSTVHSMPLNSLEHCICTTTMTNICPDLDSNLVPPGYKPQLIRMSHKCRPVLRVVLGGVSGCSTGGCSGHLCPVSCQSDRKHRQMRSCLRWM